MRLIRWTGTYEAAIGHHDRGGEDAGASVSGAGDELRHAALDEVVASAEARDAERRAEDADDQALATTIR